MKKNFLKVFSLLLVISMLAISVNAVVTDKPQSEITIAAPEQVTLYGDSATVTVTLTMPTCYGVEGKWTATDGLSLATLVADNDVTLSNDGVVVWADVAGDDEDYWFKNPMSEMTATYTVSAAGTYTVDFTCTMFVGGKQITAGEVEVWEGTFVYSKTIQVVKHVCSDVTTDTDHICDDTNCGKTVGDHAYSEGWTTDENKHWHVCDCGAKSEEATHSDVTTDADHKCDVCEKDNVTEHKHNTYGSDETQHWSICDCGQMVGEKVNHDFAGGNCVCGASLKGDVNLDGVVDMDDVVALMRHVLVAEVITNASSLANGEVTNDVALDMDDVVKLMQYVLKAIDSLD